MGAICDTSSVADRVRRMMFLRGFRSINAAAKDLGFNSSTLQTILSRNAISRKTALKIGEKWGFSPDWIERGWGPMFLAPDQTPALPQAAENCLKGVPSKIPTVTEPDLGHEELPEMVWVPKAACRLSSEGTLVVEESVRPERYAFRLDWLKLLADDPGKLVLLDVAGDSMLPTLQHNDTVLIHTGRTQIQAGRIYAVGIDGTVHIKRLEMLPGRIRVVSDNKALFEPFEATPGEIIVLGRVIWSARTWG